MKKFVSVEVPELEKAFKKVGIAVTHVPAKDAKDGSLVLKYHSATLMSVDTYMSPGNDKEIVTFEGAELADLARNTDGDMGDGFDRVIGVLNVVKSLPMYEGESILEEAKDALQMALTNNLASMSDFDKEDLQERLDSAINSLNYKARQSTELARKMMLPPFSSGDWEEFNQMFGKYSDFIDAGLIDAGKAKAYMDKVNDTFDSVMGAQTKAEGWAKVCNDIIKDLKKAQSKLK